MNDDDELMYGCAVLVVTVLIAVLIAIMSIVWYPYVETLLR